MRKRTISIISYLTLIGWLIAYLEYTKGKNSSLAKFHLEQSLGLGILVIASNSIITVTLYYNSLFSLMVLVNNMVLFILWLAGIISAYYGVRIPLPIIGFIFKNKFRFIQ
jgi:uncharacterized membrane protein